MKKENEPMRHLLTAVPFLAGLALAACSNGAPVQSGPDSSSSVVTVDGHGYHPDTLHAQAGKALTITFRRTTDRTCGTEVVFPSLDIRKNLPLNQDVAVQVTPQAGTIAFTCGMGMYRGSIVAH